MSITSERCTSSGYNLTIGLVVIRLDVPRRAALVNPSFPVRSSSTTARTLPLGDVVIVQDDFKRQIQRTLAVVEELLTGNDGLTRDARLSTSSRITTRPIIKLYPLEVHCDDN
ncbi:hypothetical protein DPMN_079670 [Dreissena polymorpha]|uniref:DUF5641 domain-containing protein n=1 Tax=Dreissena polymorpha TaxID=45954 RepID=A0A9D4BRD8_DREPO|nr:hypothetical protein DPMN_079670 [Dreissena polymorpha]